MRKKSYLPEKDGEFSTWLGTFAANIAAFAAKYGISAAEVTYIEDAAAFFAYWFAQLANTDQTKQGITKYKTEIRKGVKAGGSPSLPPAGLTFTPPTSVPPGVESTIRSIVGRIKKHQSYTTADGEVLGIEGDEQTIDLNTLKPSFKVVMQAGHPNLVWKKGVASAVKIKVNRIISSNAPPPPPGPPGPDFVFLAIDTIPDYLDTAPLPPFGDSLQWAYIMIYMIDDEEVGEWSDVVFATVTGTP